MQDCQEGEERMRIWLRARQDLDLWLEKWVKGQPWLITLGSE